MREALLFCDTVRPCVRACVRKNSEFYRGAFGGVIFSVSEVNEAHRFRHDFGEITKFGYFTNKGTIYRVPQKGPFLLIFKQKVSAYCRCKNARLCLVLGRPESVPFCSALRADVDQRTGEASDKRVWTEDKKLQMFHRLAQTSAAGLKTRNFSVSYTSSELFARLSHPFKLRLSTRRPLKGPPALRV